MQIQSCGKETSIYKANTSAWTSTGRQAAVGSYGRRENELVLELTVFAYNILRLIGQESLKSRWAPKTKHPVKRRRIRTVIGNLIQIAGHITTHGRRIVLAIGCSNVWRHVFMDVYNRFALA